MAIPSKAELLQLDIQTRLELIEELWESILEETGGGASLMTDAERELLDERLRRHREHPTGGRPWSEVRASLRNGR
jgi:putative addiction module component (TIGR02574 family)